MTQAQLAEQSGLDDMTVSRLENGVRAPSLDQLERLAGIFMVPMAHLLNEDDDPLLLRGREIASMLTPLTDQQQRFIIDFIRIYTEAHGKRPGQGTKKPKMIR